jgi:NAD(P)-dependent dehydrogenase (short-subunit alcohol dehydrogenase family)
MVGSGFDFAERHVVVTGGSGALGAAVVALLVNRGATCYVPCFSAKQVEGFGYAEHERVHVQTGVNLCDEASAVAYYEGIPTLWAALNIAGGFEAKSITDTTLNDFRAMLDMNATTCFLSSREAIKKMRAGDAGEGGRIVNVGAKPAIEPVGGMVAYAASKAAVVAITQSLAEEVKGERIWVNAVIPSIMDTKVNRAAMPDSDHSKWPQLGAVAETIAFLASPQNQVTRGAVVPVYGLS